MEPHTIGIPLTEVPRDGVISLFAKEIDDWDLNENGSATHIQTQYLPTRGRVIVSVFGDENLKVVAEAYIRSPRSANALNFSELIQDWWTTQKPRPELNAWEALARTSFEVAELAGIDPHLGLPRSGHTEMPKIKRLIEKSVLNTAIWNAYSSSGTRGEESDEVFEELRAIANFLLKESYSDPLGAGEYDLIRQQFREKYGKLPSDPVKTPTLSEAAHLLRELM